MADNYETQQAYSKMLDEELTDAEHEEASNDLVGFFAVLIEMDRDQFLHKQADAEL